MIKTHKDLADLIAGKKILLLNSLGKDSVLCLEWLTNYAYPSKVVSLQFDFFAPHPGDKPYEKYLRKRYPDVEFLKAPNAFDVTNIFLGKYQSPIDVLKNWNDSDYDFFDFWEVANDYLKELDCDYMCLGRSRYEAFDRATFFHKNGIVKDNKIFPLGFMSKKQVMSLINFKLHPVYKTSPGTLDEISYYKMRSAFLAKPEYYKQMLKFYPLLELDKYRWERLMK
jgi:3'-phosphoadenosine 5'-phosphosulfate sulfotransferase (PAPS reductase)/FAD synthetase